MASPCASPSTASLDVLPLHTDTAASSQQSAMLVKLTDDCLSAIHAAQHGRVPMKMKIDPQGGWIEIGHGAKARKFRFVVSQMPGTSPSDAVVYDQLKGYRSVASLQSKVQVQATDKTIAEKREKAQKLAEEEKRKAIKDDSRQRHDHRVMTVKRTTNQVAIGAQRPSPSSSNFSKPHQSEFSKGSQFKSAISTQNGSNASAGMADARSYVRAEISRKPLRKRIIHLVVVGKFHSADEVIAQLREDSLGSSDDGGQEAIKARDIIDEVSETGKDTGRLQLKQSFYNEVDPRWPGFKPDEKASVRKILSGNTGSASNFAPTRKSGKAPPLAPTASHTTTVSPEAIPTPPTLSNNQSRISSATFAARRSSPKASPKVAPPAIGTTNKRPLPSPPKNNNTTTTNASNPLDDLLPSPAAAVKRKAHAPPTVIPEKRARQQSLSPPEDPSSANPAAAQPAQKPVQNERTSHNTGERVANNANGSTSLITPSQPSRDWLKEFSEVRSLAEAEKYYNMFLAEYPQYMECFNRLSLVANEFSELEKQLAESPRHTREYEKVERAIQTKYSHYQRDADFLHTRQKHADLRAKLDVLKKRIASWEACHAGGEASRHEQDSQTRVPDNNLLIM